MQQIHVKLARDNEFHEAVFGTDALKEGGDLMVITKDNGTETGRGIAVLTFTVDVDGKHKRAQTVTTIRALKGLLRILDARYDDNGRVRGDVVAEG